jgi:hypothetical protein
VFYADDPATGCAWSGPLLVLHQGALVTFNLPPASEGQRINGMLHLKWEVSDEASWAWEALPYRGTPVPTLMQRPLEPPPETSTKSDEPEKILSDLVANLGHAQREKLRKNLGDLAEPPTRHVRPVKLQGHALVGRLPADRSIGRRVVNAPDPERSRRDLRVMSALRQVLGDAVPAPPSDFDAPARRSVKPGVARGHSDPGFGRAPFHGRKP